MTLQLDTSSSTHFLPPFHHLHLHPQLQQQHQHQQHSLRRVPSTCDRHPDELVTGFCASCLRERLAGLETRRNSPSSSSSSSAFKSAFFKPNPNPPLRRCKSFSCGRRDGIANISFEPQRKSCDVRGRSTLWSLFNQDNKLKDAGRDSLGAARIQIEAGCPNVGVLRSGIADPVLESREDDGDEAEIRPADPEIVVETTEEIAREEELEGQAELKPMKDHIDLDAQAKKPSPKDLKEIAGSFWMAASVFSKKLQKWRRKQKLKKQGSTKAGLGAPTEKPSNARRFGDTQSEIALDAFGRRSCDTDPRFSLDMARFSLDYSWDEPRASWDGYLIGGRAPFPRAPPSMLSVIEDRPAPPTVQRADGQIPVEEDSMAIPGGSAQTRDYYLDSSSQRRRRSLDRSNSVRKLSVELNEQKPLSNTGATELHHGHNGMKLERDSRELNSNSLQDDCSENLESSCRHPCKGGEAKKSKRWGKKWSIWGFIHWRSGGKGGDSEVGRSFSESWPELRRQGSNGKVLRCNSTVSSRHSFSGGSTGSGRMRRSYVETNDHGRKRREEFVLERNRSARHSPSQGDNGMLRFYLTPMQGTWRNRGLGKNRNNGSHLLARSMLQLY
ncbi:hypothetical protein J5N97_006218 [Dioscorea zingiberensis]|uniref:Uncharacterized protein n=1 Tax=Dioscorea zingiberensis TaxID=325984 RepID=A0A9D5DCN7_9LILI|nr:hypothetical protein J5N97_006218 [Dioscorea zingiberensis]